MRIALELGAREQARVVKRGMIEPVRKHRVAAPDERGDHTNVRHITGRKLERARQGDKARKRFLQRVVRFTMAEDQVRSAGADAVACATFLCRSYQSRMIGEPEIVVA